MENSKEGLNSDRDSSEDEENVEKSTESVRSNLETANGANKNILIKNKHLEDHESNKRIRYDPNCIKDDNVPVNSNINNIVSQIVALFGRKQRKSSIIFNLPVDVLEIVIKYLSNNDKLNFILCSKILMQIVGGSHTILRSFVLIVAIHTLARISETPEVLYIPFRNIELDFDHLDNQQDVQILFNNFKESVEILELKNSKFVLTDFFSNLSNLKTLTLENCHFANLKDEALPIIPSLQTIFLKNCNENVFKVFQLQTNLVKITIQSDIIELSNEIFINMASNFECLEHLVLIGEGTRSFLDIQEHKFKLKKFETSMLTYNWYTGIKTERISFLKSQLGHLKELTMHELPNDFDGGRVLKFILNEMNLETFYYGKIPLILNRLKQEVKELEFTEIQISSGFEMVRQFPAITSLRLTLSSTEISTQEIEKIINPRTNLFESIEELEVVDNSKPRNILGVFTGFFKNLRNLEKLTIRTQDYNINVLLEEFLPYMKKLTEICITSTGRKHEEMFKIIKTFVPNLVKISIPREFMKKARQIFNSNVEICEIN